METRKLYRSRNKTIGGVCQGLATYFKTDPVLIKLIFVFGALWSCGFPFILLYIVLWIITPKEPKPEEITKTTTTTETTTTTT